jgi:glycosyltransferase involved in cell wall biosynthesis
MTAPAVSVLVPVHNAGLFLASALNSVFAQTLAPHEVLVLNDGSTDETESVARRFGERIRYMAQTPRGAGATRARLVDSAIGDWVAFLDADDLWTPDKLARQAESSRARADVDIVFCHMKRFRGATVNRAWHTPEAAPLPGASFIRRSLFKKIGNFRADQPGAAFFEWLSRARDEGVGELMLPDILVHRRAPEDDHGERGAEHEEYMQAARDALIRRGGRGA